MADDQETPAADPAGETTAGGNVTTPAGTEEILQGLEPYAKILGVPAADLLALALSYESADPPSADGGYFACIAFMGRNEYTGYVTRITKNGQPAYHIDLPEKLWGGNPLSWVEYAASAWFSEYPVTEASIRRAWDAKVAAAARRAREEAEWRAAQEQRALDAADAGYDQSYDANGWEDDDKQPAFGNDRGAARNGL